MRTWVRESSWLKTMMKWRSMGPEMPHQKKHQKKSQKKKKKTRS
jgi:hypothetical protein